MADHNDDLLDDDGLDGPAYEVDLADADEDALLADDYDDTPIHRKVIERLPEEDDFIELGVEDDISEDIRNEGVDNGSLSFDNANDSDDEVKERSRFKTERNITLTPARPNKPIPETLDAVPVKTVIQPVRVRGGGHQQPYRRGGRGHIHFRGRGRGGGPHHFPPDFRHHQNFNNYQQQPPQGGYYPPPQHQQYGPPPHQMPPPQQMPPGPPYHQQHPPQQPPAYHQPQQGPPPQQYYNPPPQQPPPQQPPPLQQPPPHQIQQLQPPPQQQLPPAAPPVIPAGQKILVNPHFKNNLGTIWNGISNWNQQNPPQQVQQPNDQQYVQQRDWEGSNQDYYQTQETSQSYNQYTDNQYYQPPQDQYYQQNPPPSQPYTQQPPPGPPQQTSNWDGNANTSYYPPAGPPSQFSAPPDQVAPHPQGPPGPGYPPPGPMGPPPPGPPQMGPPGPRGPPHFMGPGGGPPPLRGLPPPRGRGGMHVNPNMMGSPRKMMRMQSPMQQQAPSPGAGNVRMRLNTNRPNFIQNKKFGNNFNAPNQGNKFRQQHQNLNQQPNKLFPGKLQRGDVLKKLKPPTSANIVPIKTEDQIPVVPPEDEDEETKAYRKKIEEQKKMREDLLRQKEERRKVAAQQKLQQLEEGGTQPANTGTSQGDPATTYKTVRIMQSDGTTVLRKLTLAQIAKLKKITPGSTAAKQPAKKEEPASKVVVVENLSASTSSRQLSDMARSVGVVENIKLDAEAKKAVIRFTSVDTAQTFVRRNHRKMVDLSMIQVTMVPEPSPQTPKPT